MTGTFKLDGLDCANCAAKIERAVKKLDGVTEATVNFLSAKMIIEGEDEKFDAIASAAAAAACKVDANITVKRI